MNVYTSACVVYFLLGVKVHLFVDCTDSTVDKLNRERNKIDGVNVFELDFSEEVFQSFLANLMSQEVRPSRGTYFLIAFRNFALPIFQVIAFHE